MKKKLILLGIFFALILVGIVIARLNSVYTKIYTQGSTWSNPIPKEKTVFSFAVIGYGGPGHQGAYLTDTIMIARIDTKAKKALLISVPRDIWVKIPTVSGEDFYSKVNAVYQMGLFPKNYPDIDKKYASSQGAANLLKEALDEITGFPIDYYGAIDFNGFVKAVDTLGGVEVNVERTFTDVEYPIDGKETDPCGKEGEELMRLEAEAATGSAQLLFPCRYENLHFEKGQQTLDGKTALKFVRSRHALEDGGDFGRAKRQQLFVQALRDRVLSVGFIPKIVPLLGDLEDNVRMDVPQDVIKKFLGELSGDEDYKIDQIILTTDNYLKNDVSDDGQYILTSKNGLGIWTLLQKDIKNTIGGITPTPSVVPKPSVVKKKAL